MMEKIRSQAQSLARVVDHQYGDGSDSLIRAADLLRSGRQIVITGMGASFFAALPLESQLCSLGIRAVAIEAGELLHYRHKAYRDAVVLMVSRSGESVEIARLLALFKGRQPVIGISNIPESLLGREADIAISIASMNDDVVALQTYTGTLLTLYLLGKAVEGQLSAAKAEIEALLPRFGDLVDSSLKNIGQWDDFLRPGTSLYLLGRGYSCASMLEGALLFHEVAKSPAVSMASASFRHGPVEVVDANFRGLIFAPIGAGQKLNVALARDVVRFGSQVRVLGPTTASASELPNIELPETSEMLAPLCEIIPIQVAALRLAEMRGIAPGSFRFAPAVALDEENFSQLPGA
jgi:glucosamine--fructose-6-phosphate aminotransferase (isomerizing)